LYALKLKSDLGVPTLFTFNEGKYRLLGKVKEETQVIEKMDPAVGETMRFFENEAVFSQLVQFTEPGTVVGEVEYMVCDDSRCLPPTRESFSLSIGGAATPTNNDHNNPSVGAMADPVKWNFSFTKTGETTGELVAKARIQPKWHLYSQNIQKGGPEPTEITFEKTNGVALEGKALESGGLHKTQDPVFNMPLAFFEKEAIFTQKVTFSSESKALKGSIHYMVCDDKQCMPPTDISFSINLATGEAKETTQELLNDAPVVKVGVIPNMSSIDLSKPLAQCDTLSTDTSSDGKSGGTIFLLGFLGGLIALLTPCVFPMIPMTVSFFTKGGRDPKKGLRQAMIYGFFIFLIYVLLSLPFHFLDSIEPEILNNISTNVWLNLVFFVIFVVFAISFFGYFEITLPSGIANKVDQKSDAGGLIGSFFMALTLAIVSFSCTGPILGSLLVGSISKDGGAFQLTLGMAGFGLALALPFTLFAAFPGLMKKLPQSGGWMSKLKVILGFLEVALALKFLSNADLVAHWSAIKYELFLGVWALVALAMALYAFGVIKFPHDDKEEKHGWKWKTFGVILLGVTAYLLSGFRYNEKSKTFTSLSLLSGLAPPAGYSWMYPNHCPNNLPCFHDLEEGLAYSKQVNKPVMLDFTGWACVNCRKMEENVWPKPEIDAILRNDVVLISLYVDDKEQLPKELQGVYETKRGTKKNIKTVGDKWSTLQSEYFGSNTQPQYILMTPDRRFIGKTSYTPDVNQYKDFLICGLRAFSTK
jgi:thiol:disulfide interchange protein DsbD